MSLVGNFTSNYDREATSGGVPPAEAEEQRPAPSHVNDNEKPRTASSSDSSTIAPNVDSPPRRENHHHDNKDTTYASIQNSDEVIETNRREAAVHRLARQLTSQSNASTQYQNPFNAPPNSALDPNGEHFNARAWTRAMLKLQLDDENAAPTRTAGVSFRGLNVHGYGKDTDYQKSVGNVWLEGPGLFKRMMGDKGRKINILQHLDGLVEAGEMLVVLGPPGSGCSTFLKTITGETHGFNVDSESHINYQGVSPELMNKNYRGEAIYTAEVDVHFPMMTVGETLYFAAQARRPRHIPGGVSVKQYAEHQRDV